MSSRCPFVLVTGNASKVIEARRILGLELDSVEVDLPEIQSLDQREILAAKGEEAWRQLGRPLVVEETGFELDAMGGFPGPLVKWMLAAIGPEGIARCALALGNPVARARCQVLYRDSGRTIIGEGIDEGRLVLPPRGDAGFGWDSVFVPEGKVETWAELGDGPKDELGHRGRAWRDLRRCLQDRGLWE